MLVSSLYSLSALAKTEARFKLSSEINQPAPFISHVDSTDGYWLGRNVNYLAVKAIYQQLQKRLPALQLKTRGDAHITVITPPEYKNILKPYLTPKEIDQIAKQMNIQASEFTPVCLGRGQKLETNGKAMQTYFIVVKSLALLKLRQKIYEEYVAKGGVPSRFDPQHFTPHITVGFTNRDLFESDGVYKQANACISKLVLITSHQM